MHGKSDIDMKRCLIGAALAVAAIPAMAGERPLFDTSRPVGAGISVGVHYTIGATSVLENYASVIGGVAAMDVTPGVGTGVGATVEFGIRNYLALGTQFDFMLGNHRYSMVMLNPDMERQSTLMVRNHYYWADVPVYFSLRLNLAPHTRLNVDLGAYFGFGIGGRQTASIYNIYANSIGQTVVSSSDDRWPYYGSGGDGSMVLLNKVSRVDIGLHTGLGLTVREHYMVGAVFHVGCRNLAIPTAAFSPEYHTIQCQFKLGYIF